MAKVKEAGCCLFHTLSDQLNGDMLPIRQAADMKNVERLNDKLVELFAGEPLADGIYAAANALHFYLEDWAE